MVVALMQARWPKAARAQQAPAQGAGRGKAGELSWPGPLLDHPQLRRVLEADKDNNMLLQAAEAELVALLSQPAPKQAWYKAARVLQAHRAAGKKPSALCQEAVAAWITAAAGAADRSAPGVAAAAASAAGGGAEGAEAAAVGAAERSAPGADAAAASAAGGGAEGTLPADEPGSGGSALGSAAAGAAPGSSDPAAQGSAAAAAAGPERSGDGTLNVPWCLHTLASVWALLALRDKGGVAARTLPEVLPALQRCLDAAGGAEGASLHIYARGSIILALPGLRTAQALEDAVAVTAALSWDATCVCAALRALSAMCAALLDMPGGRARVWSGKALCMRKP